jgi:hypothetical protein
MARTHSTGHRTSLTHLSAFSRIRHMPHSLLRWQMSSPLQPFPPISRCFHDVLDEVLGTHGLQQRDTGRLCVARRGSGRVRRGAGFGVELLPCLSSCFVHYGKKVSRYFAGTFRSLSLRSQMKISEVAVYGFGEWFIRASLLDNYYVV